MHKDAHNEGNQNDMPMDRRRFLRSAAFAASAVVLAACGGGGETAGTNSSANANTGTGAETNTNAGAGAATNANANANTGTETNANANENANANANENANANTNENANANTNAEPPAATTAAAGGQEAGYSIVVPQGLRTDLKGKTIKWLAGADGPGKPFENAAVKKFADATGIQVQNIAGPDSTTDRLAQYLQQWGAQSSDVDVYQIDVIWPGIVAPHAVDLTDAMKDQISAFFPAIVKNNTVDNKLVGVPWYTDAGILYYRTDLLKKYGFDKPPATWKELEDMAKKIQEGERQAGNKDFWGFTWQGKAYEGLTCDALEWQFSNGGGQIIEPDGTVSINNPQAIAAFDMAKGWVGNITPTGVTTYTEPESLNVFTASNAAFMRNWPYAVAVSNAADSKIKGLVAVTQLPQGDGDKATHAATLGGWQLMVSNYSQNKDAATEFVKYMTSPELQKASAIERTLLPTRPAVYDDPDVLQANPYYKDLKPVFQGGAVPRPSTVSGELYNEVSTAYFNGVNQILTGAKDSKSAAAEIEQKLKDIMATK